MENIADLYASRARGMIYDYEAVSLKEESVCVQRPFTIFTPIRRPSTPWSQKFMVRVFSGRA